MNTTIVDAVAKLRHTTSLPLEPLRRGPILLQRVFDEIGLQHCEVNDLTRGKVFAQLAAWGHVIEVVGDTNEPLEGFLFTAGATGYVFISRNARNILPRRRFSVAHEIGHFLLHRAVMDRWREDRIIDVAADDPIEKEANRFAAELLMPREVCEARADEMRRTSRACPRGVLAYRLAAELLVSREAMTYRLRELEVGDA